MSSNINFLQRKSKEPMPEDEKELEPEIDKLFENTSSSLPPINPEQQLQKIMDCILPPR